MKKKIILPLIVSFFALTSCNGTNQEESKFTVTWKNHDGTVSDPYSVKDALTKANETGATATSEEYYIKGIISEITEVNTTNFGNATFSIKDSLDDEVSFLAYRVKWGEGGVFFTSETAENIVVGNEVLLLGKIINYQNNTPEVLQNSKVISTDKTPAIYAEAKAFADWMMDASRDTEACTPKYNEALLKWNLLSQEAKDMFIEHSDFENAELRLNAWAIANGESIEAIVSGTYNTKEKSPFIDKESSLAATLIIGIIGLTILIGYFFIKKRQE